MPRAPRGPNLQPLPRRERPTPILDGGKVGGGGRKGCSYTMEELRQKARERHLRRSYGINASEYGALLSRQAGVCAICGQPEQHAGGRHGDTQRQLAVDHDHETGMVRGLLCSFCNTAIGALRHDVNLLARAITYLTGELVLAESAVDC